MAKIKHIALSTANPEATAKFYVDVFGMKEIGRLDNPNLSGFFLTDGDLNLAILKFKNDVVAGVERGKDWTGIHHFGFQVESLEGGRLRDGLGRYPDVRPRSRDAPAVHLETPDSVPTSPLAQKML